MNSQVLQALQQVATLVFVVSSMLAMGLSLTVGAIVAPLRHMRLVAVALAANFIAVPLFAILLQSIVKLDEPLYAGLLLVATAAGAPFLPKLAEAAKGDIALSVGLMVLLMVTTVLYMPIVLPLLLPDVQISPWDIASSLVFLMLLPLAAGLFIKSRYIAVAQGLQPHMAQTSSLSIAILIGAGVLANFTQIIGLVGTGGIVAILAFLLGALAIGYFAGGKDPGTRAVLGLGTAQRNLSAALVVASQNFGDTPDTLTFIIVAALIGLVSLMLFAGELGRRSKSTTAANGPKADGRPTT